MAAKIQASLLFKFQVINQQIKHVRLVAECGLAITTPKRLRQEFQATPSYIKLLIFKISSLARQWWLLMPLIPMLRKQRWADL